MNSIVFLLSNLIVATALSSNSHAHPQGGFEPPPAALDSQYRGGSHLAMNFYSGVLGYNLQGMTVSVLWEWQGGGPESTQHSVQVEAVPFWPTEAISAGVGRIAVAGKQRDQAVVEIWTLEQTPAPHGVHDLGSGEWSYPELSAPILSKRQVLSQSFADKGPVSAMFYNSHPAQGIALSLWVWFQESGELYRLDYSSSGSTTLSLVASASPAGSGVLQVPALAIAYRTRWAADHPQHGHVMILSHYFNSPATDDGLILLDEDQDGVIDLAFQVSGSAWNQDGWADASQYSGSY